MLYNTITFLNSNYWLPVATASFCTMLVALVYLYRVNSALEMLAADQHRTTVLTGFSWAKVLLRTLFLFLATAACLLALLRPQADSNGPQLTHEYGRDIIITIDISRSMLVEDCQGESRLNCVRKKIDALLHTMKSERVALIVFSDTALVLCPLTKDLQAFRMFVEMLDEKTVSAPGSTSLANALRTAASLFTHQPERRNKLLVVFTDGEDFSKDLEAAQKEAESIGLQTTVVAVGTADGGPIPSFDAKGVKVGYQRNAQGEIVISHVNEQLLKQLAYRCKGLFCPFTNQHLKEAQTILSWIRQYEEEKGSALMSKEKNELFMYFSGFALGALVCAIILS